MNRRHPEPAPAHAPDNRDADQSTHGDGPQQVHTGASYGQPNQSGVRRGQSHPYGASSGYGGQYGSQQGYGGTSFGNSPGQGHAEPPGQDGPDDGSQLLEGTGTPPAAATKRQ